MVSSINYLKIKAHFSTFNPMITGPLVVCPNELRLFMDKNKVNLNTESEQFKTFPRAKRSVVSESVSELYEI